MPNTMGRPRTNGRSAYGKSLVLINKNRIAHLFIIDRKLTKQICKLISMEHNRLRVAFKSDGR